MRDGRRRLAAKRRVLLGAVVAVTDCASTPPDEARKEEAPMPAFQIDHDGFIEHLAGDWRLIRRMRNRVVESTVRAEWVLGRKFLRVHMKDAAEPPDYEAIVLIGHDDEGGRYVAHWCDTFGGRYSAVGFGTRSGDAVEFAFQYPEGPFFNTFTWDTATGRWTFRMESSGEGGKRSLFAEDTLRR